MGRPSKLSISQWAEVERRLAAGEKAADLSREFRVSKAVISSRFSKRIETVKAVANQLVNAEQALRSLPVPEQILAIDLARDLADVARNLASAARYGAATAHRLTALANAEVQKIDDADPLGSIKTVRDVAVLTKLANDSASIPLNLLAANKDTIKQINDDAMARDAAGKGGALVDQDAVKEVLARLEADY